MEATITGEDDIAVGLSVIDNNEEEHLIEMEMDGEIYHHNQDAYADHPDNRSPEGRKHVGQAARYAKYYVYRERGYNTLASSDSLQDPNRLITTAMVIHSLSADAFEHHFGDLYRQLKSHAGAGEPVVHVKDAVMEDAFMVYAKEIYLGLEDTDLAEVIETLSTEDATDYLRDAVTLLEDEETGAAGVLDQLAPLAAEYGLEDDLSETLEPEQCLDATPTVYPKWRIGTQIHEDPDQLPDIDREPDCCLDIVPYDPDSIEDLQEYIIQHITCQVRDCFVSIGVTPPEPFRVQGPGQDFITMQYQHFDYLQPYHDPDAEIDWENV
ncbi:hypothetical protein [Natrinema pallidum]|uniref:Uncharacterized protein n=1 Tax=Natrinema pallidum TaxID=69527 RepID=A0A4V1IEK6_9EURY|nr:hypothetical protein [Natrinema pallidum]QCW01824.1 hypothetical protein FGF80_00580 [Natrinema pallidum]